MWKIITHPLARCEILHHAVWWAPSWYIYQVVRRLLPILIGCLPACMPAADPPAARGVLPPPLRPPPPVERRPNTPPPPQRPAPQAPELDDPFALPPTAHDFSAPSLPTAWPEAAFDLVATRHARRVIASDDVVGVAAVDGLVAVSGEGGIFRVDGFGTLTPARTRLPTRVTRTFAAPGVLVACTPPLDQARFSVDGGEQWAALGFQCGRAGARTIAGAGAHTYAVAGDRLRIGPLPAGAATYRPLPVAEVEAIGALERRVLLVGAEALALSVDGGAHFTHLSRPPGLAAARDVAFVGKGTVLIAGQAAPGGAALVRSVDLGRSWAPIALPRRLDHVVALAVDARGAVLAVPADAADEAVLSFDGGRRFEPLPPGHLAQGAVAALDAGFVAGARGGLLVGVGASAPQLGLREPLHAAVFTHPRIAVGIGRTGGVFRSSDGGRTWQASPAGRWIPFGDVTRIGDHALMLVGDGLLWRSEDAGRTWDQRWLPALSSCAARWVRFSVDGARGTVGCADGSWLQSDDAGLTWAVDPAAPGVETAPVVWWEGKRWALSADGRLWTDAAGPFAEVASPLADPVHLVRTAEGLSLLARGGQGAVRSGDAWQATRWIDPPGDARHHLPLGDGGALLVAGDRLVRVSPTGPPQAVADDALDARLTGDGGVLLFGARSTTLLEAR